LFVALCTIPRGVSHWREFWHYYEAHHQISLRFLTPLYVFLCLLGILSTAVVLQR
jgi:hypothetical protein